MRAVPFMPYFNFSPSAWVLPLKFGGGGYRAGGGASSTAKAISGPPTISLLVGRGRTVYGRGTPLSSTPTAKPLSPNTTGFTGGGMEGGTFGAAIDAKDNAWFSTYGSKSIVVFDKNGKPLTPPDGITFNGRLGLMQGIIATPNGDVWALGLSKGQLVYFPKGDPTKGRIVCEGARTPNPASPWWGRSIWPSTSRTVSG